MFGDATFSQTPFAATSGETFVASLSEAVDIAVVNDCVTQKGGLFQDVATAAATFVSANNVMLATAAETAVGTDTQTVLGVLLGAQAETVSATAALTNQANMLASQAETASGAATQTANSVVYAAIDELASAIGSFNGFRVFAVAIDESASGSNAQTAQVIFSGTVAEVASVSSIIDVLRIANVSVTGVQLRIDIGNELIWVEVITNQSPGWTSIPS